jgi:hypothetical protein
LPAADSAAPFTVSRQPKFTFISTEPDSTFECRVDGGPFAACDSPFTTAKLDEGAHNFDVRARDHSENFDATPASRSFTVDLSVQWGPRPAPILIDDVAPLVSLRVRRRERISTIIRSGIPFGIGVNEAARIEARLEISRRVARRLSLVGSPRGRSRVAIGRASAKLAARGTAVVRVRLTPLAKRRLTTLAGRRITRLPKLEATLRLTVTDRLGNARALARKIRFRR